MPAKTSTQRGTKQSSAPRVLTHDDKQREKGRTGRKKWLTPAEHDQVDNFIKKIRSI